MPKLTWTVHGETRSFDVKESCSIGRLETCDVPLVDETGASRRHCQILKIPSGFELSDLGSTNGTKVNGQTVKRARLKDGDEIRIGETALRWSEGSGPAKAAAGDDDVLLEGDVSIEEPVAAHAPKAAGGGGGGTSEQCYLVFAGGPRDTQKIALEKKRITFGRNPKNVCVLGDDAGVSGYHCEVSREGGTYVLRDLGSTNGTFVDGEQVTEVALQHGSRIRLGQTRLVFVDPTVSDFEKAMSAVEDLGSEWGMLRAEMDMSRVQAAKRSQLVAIGGILVVLAGAGYVAIAHPEMISGGEKPPQAIPGNLFGADFSFEAGTGGWTALAGSPALGRYGAQADGAQADGAQADGAAWQGKAFYAVTRDGPAGRAAAVGAGDKDRPRVNPSAAYGFGARVRTGKGGQACVRVSWLASDGRTMGENTTDLVSSDAWVEVRGAVAQPPRDAVAARIDLLNAGPGTAFFDDVYFGAPAAAPRAAEAKAGDVSVQLGSDGQATVRRGNQVLLAAGSAVAGALRPETGPAGRWDRVGGQKGSSASGGGAAASAKGQAFDGIDGTWASWTANWKVDANRFVDLEADLPEGTAIVAALAGGVLDEGISVRTETSYTRVSEARTFEKVRQVKIGERNAFEIAAADGDPSWRFSIVRLEGGEWGVAIGSHGGKVRLRIDTDTAAINDGLRKLDDAARESRMSKRLGKAIGLYRALETALPQGSPQAADAAKAADEIERAANEEYAKVASARAAAVEFQDDAELRTLEARAVALAKQFDGHEVGTKAAAEAAAIVEANAKRRLVLDDRAAAPMVARAADYVKLDDHAIARAILRDVISGYPGTESAKKAKEVLDGLPSGN